MSVVENKFLIGLNDRQQEAVRTTEGPLLIMAGAGSGKTRVLTHRIGYLMDEKDVSPWNILAITFTNKAAREMRERLEKLVGEKANDLWVSTFHSMCVRILRRDIELIGYNRNFTILDQTDAQNIVKQVVRDLNLSEKQFAYKQVHGAISEAKNDGMLPKEFEAKAGNHPYLKVISQVYTEYQKRLRRNSCLDFDDLILKTIELFEVSPETLQFYQRKFQYIHVDEYQDTNRTQYLLVKMMGKRLKNVCVVGDSDQSIYGWRGADISNILEFEKDYDNAKSIMLEQNYRSTQKILEAANNVVDRNTNRRKKNLWTKNAEGEKITYYRGKNESDEAAYVVEQIRDLTDFGGFNLSQTAILYRTNAMSRKMEDMLIKSVIPYKIYGGLKFYDRKEIKDIIAHLRLIVNPDDDTSFERVINEPKRAIGPAAIDKIRTTANAMNLSMLKALDFIEATGLAGKAKMGAIEFSEVIANATRQQGFLSVKELVVEVLDKSGYKRALELENSLEAESRLENLEEFLSVAEEFDKRKQEGQTMIDFLTDISLLTDMDSDTENDDNKVTLMTLHSAKGLEFPVVFIVGFEENIFPSSRSKDDKDAMEEERRLAYVGITRAENKLYLTNAIERLLYGRSNYNPESRFLGEIPSELIENKTPKIESMFKTKSYDNKYGEGDNVGFGSSYKPTPVKQVSVSRPVIAQSGGDKIAWQVGDKASHAKWGIGIVKNISGSPESLELHIEFPDVGAKKLMAKFAPITKWYK